MAQSELERRAASRRSLNRALSSNASGWRNHPAPLEMEAGRYPLRVVMRLTSVRVTADVANGAPGGVRIAPAGGSNKSCAISCHAGRARAITRCSAVEGPSIGQAYVINLSADGQMAI